MSLQRFFKLGLGDTFIGSALGKVPFVESLYRRSALFRRDHSGLFYGVYASYDEACADIPKSRLSGWDNEELTTIWLNDIAPMQASTYPIFLWLSRLLNDGSTLVDYGGGIGITYYAYLRYVPLPAGVRWEVVEVPHMVEMGRRIAEREGSSLIFSTEPRNALPADILLSAGALQYMKTSVPGFLEAFASRPKHLLLNKVPLTDKPSFWTLQNFGDAISPYQIFNEAAFLGYFKENGYILRDRWGVYEIDCFIPFHPDRCVPYFAGLYFERSEQSAPTTN